MQLQDKLSGDPGKVLYCNGGENLQFRPILNDNLYVCLTEQEVEYCKIQGIDYNYIMQKWIKWGHYEGYQYGIDPEFGLVLDSNKKPALDKNGNTIPIGNIGTTEWCWNDKIKRIADKIR